MRVPLCVIPAGGQGTRMGPGPPKCLREIRGGPIIQHVVDWWARQAEQIVVVSRHEAQMQSALIGTGAVVVYEPEPHGVTAAVLRGLEAVRCPPQFVVALGDCLWDGEFGEMPDQPFSGVGVMYQPESEWGRSYAVGNSLVEKPYLGLGCFFLSWFDLWALKCSENIVEAMACIQSRGCVAKVEFRGAYRTVTYPSDLDGWPGV